MTAVHGRSVYQIDGKLFPNRRIAIADANRPDPDAPQATSFRFTRMFPEQLEQPAEEHLEALGQAMKEDLRDPLAESRIPAGYTYLGQFIAHEVTHNGTAYPGSVPIPAENILQLTSPSLDLGSIYGSAMFETRRRANAQIPYLLDIDFTKHDDHHPELDRYANDLPRRKGVAAVPEPRNDNNLNVAQIHVALIRFHNAVAIDAFKNGGASEYEIRKIVIQHFQSVVLHDFLHRLMDENVYADVLANRPIFYKPQRVGPHDYPAMPVEFALAAFRFGHSMVRSEYHLWNLYHTADMAALFAQTNVVGGIDQLPSGWIADWGRLFAFSAAQEAANPPIYARRIDTRITLQLKSLDTKVLPTQAPSSNLAVRTLLYGGAALLPSAQSAILQLNAAIDRCPGERRPCVRELSGDELRDGESEEVRDLMEESGMITNTPLWFYILKEAQIQKDGERLGSLGSRIVMEVLYSILFNSPHSILGDADWKPSLPASSDHFKMVDLLKFAGDLTPYSD